MATFKVVLATMAKDKDYEDKVVLIEGASKPNIDPQTGWITFPGVGDDRDPKASFPPGAVRYWWAIPPEEAARVMGEGKIAKFKVVE